MMHQTAALGRLWSQRVFVRVGSGNAPNSRSNELANLIVPCANACLFSSIPGNRPQLRRSESFKYEAPKAFSTQEKDEEENATGEPRKVVITGAAGNLGQKAAKHLLESKSGKYKLVLMDTAPCPEEFKETSKNGHSIEYTKCDFSKFDNAWADKFASAHGVFLFAAKHPQPNASSSDVFTSMMINSNLLEACSKAKVDRVVLASSNHVMGGMLHESGRISADARPKIGTRYSIPGASMDSTLYASAKVAAEVQTKAMVDSGRLNKAIIARIGFCQPGDNKKETLPVTGNPSVQPQKGRLSERDKQAQNQIMRWWKGMYLSNQDFTKLVDRCLNATAGDAKRVMYVNGVSANPEARWEIDRNDIGFSPAAI
jgi:nucleoside-diphosphate-sugar epimerase